MRMLPVILALSLSVCPALGQEYPTKPIRLIVPLVPGGGVDSLARGIASSLTGTFNHTVVVDNRAGASGSIGAILVARAAPDGYTLLMASTTFLLYALLHPGAYDPVRDFSPITQAVSVPHMLIVNSGVPAATVGEFIALARSRPGTLKYGSSGSGGFPHLEAALFQSITKTDLVHIPYKGAAGAVPDLIAGQIQFMFAGIFLSMPHIKSGKLRALAVTSRDRIKSAPELPSLHEAGVTGFDATQSYGLLAPAKTPRPIIERLHRNIAAALQRPELIAVLAGDGAEAVGGTPEQYGQHILQNMGKWRKVIKEAGVRDE